MPFITKVEANARRAAKAERERLAQQAGISQPEQPAEHLVQHENPKPSKRRRGHATKGLDGKWQATGDYPTGFARTPEDTRFKPGCKAGPGRPKKSLSHDTLMKRELEKKRPVRLDGKECMKTARELIAMTTVRDAVEGKDKNARKLALAEMQRLYPGESEAIAKATDLSSSDLLSMAEFEDELRQRLREEILRELGDPDGEAEQ